MLTRLRQKRLRDLVVHRAYSLDTSQPHRFVLLFGRFFEGFTVQRFFFFAGAFVGHGS